MAYVLYRGEYDKRRDPVKPDTPDALPRMPADLPRNRLGLARWLVRPEHPLTARVMVNRFWQEVFGTGLVRTTGDFGVSGELPSHPELLDWLAVEFRESGWDVKRLFRHDGRLVDLPAVGRDHAGETRKRPAQSPAVARAAVPHGWRNDPRLRPGLRAACLVGKLGGPSVKPYQPEGVWEAVAMPESNTHFYQPDHGESLYRRSMYTFWKRSAPPASLDIFNAPTRETCTVRRERTNTPLQALVTLNDPQFVEAARALAQRALERGGRDRRRSHRLHRPAVAGAAVAARGTGDRPGVACQAERLLSVAPRRSRAAARRRRIEGRSALDPATLAAWTMLINELMNLDEFLNK